MAPDLNSVPSSPRNLALPSHQASSPPSRRSSNMTAAPLLPLGSPGGTIPPTHASTSPPTQSPTASTNASTNAEPFIPIRHPRPLTAAELHLELEKEQEAVVNRLTRELSILRAQNSASVASTTSSTTSGNTPSSAAFDVPYPTDPLSTHPSTTLRHRSSSSLSARSAVLLATSPAAPLTGASQASVDRARDAAGRAHSRQNSIPPPAHPLLRSGAPSPSLSAQQQDAYFGGMDPRRLSLNSAGGGASVYAAARSPSRTRAGSARLEEVAQARAALEVARGENEALAARVKQLERLVRAKRGPVRRGTAESGSSVGDGV